MSRLIAVWSPSGAGATTVLLNTAAAMGARRSRVAALDLHLNKPDLALAADLLPHDCPQDACLSRLMPALEGGRLTPAELARHLLTGPGFHLLPGMLDVVVASHMTEAHVRQIVQVMAGQFDTVLADLPPALDSVACLPVLELADRILLVAGPGLASRFHTRRYALILRALGLEAKCLAVLNRAGSIPVRRVAQDLDLPVRATVPECRDLAGLVEAGQIAYLSQSLQAGLTRFRTAIDDLAMLLLQEG